jgi:hypothetical protein
LSAISSLTVTYGLVASPYLTPASKDYSVQFWTPRLNLQHTSVLQAHSGEHSDREFSSSQDANLQNTYWQHCAEEHVGHCHSEVFSASHGPCHSEVFCAPYSHCHSGPYRKSAVVMNVPGPRTVSHQKDAAPSHSCHSNTVLYPRSYSECQLPLSRSRRDITGSAFPVQNSRRIFAITALCSLAPLQTYQHIYSAM